VVLRVAETLTQMFHVIRRSIWGLTVSLISAQENGPQDIILKRLCPRIADVMVELPGIKMAMMEALRFQLQMIIIPTSPFEFSVRDRLYPIGLNEKFAPHQNCCTVVSASVLHKLWVVFLISVMLEMLLHIFL
jgi:hypothetical protein